MIVFDFLVLVIVDKRDNELLTVNIDEFFFSALNLDFYGKNQTFGK